MWLSRDQLSELAESLDLVGPDENESAVRPSGASPTISGFTIDGEIGRGGMGTVYRATQAEPPRTVAIKVIDPSRISRSTLRWFRQEARALGRLDHPALARIHQTGTYEDGERAWPYIAMEYVRGRSLADADCRAALSMRERVRVIESLARAVQHAHTRGVIHRDLKPANVLLDESMTPPRAKIVDFGVAQITEPEQQLSTLHTHAAPIVGTMQYMSPEQVAGDPRDIDSRADVYSLGVMLYELISGALPFHFPNRNLSEAARIIRDDDARHVRDVAPSVPRDLATITMKAIARDPAERYGSASELAADLDRYLSHQPIDARPPSATYRVVRFAQRNRVLVALGTLVFVVLLSATIGMAIALDRARAANERAVRVLDGIVDPLQDLSEFGGGRTLRAEALPILEQYASELIEDAPDDPAAVLLFARVRVIEGDLQFDAQEYDGARVIFDSVYQSARPWVEIDAPSPDLCDLYSLALVRRGDCERRLGDPVRALATYEEAFASEQRFSRLFPDAPSFHDDLIWGYERVGMLALAYGDPKRGEQLLHERLQLAIAHWEADPDSDVRRFGVMCAHQSIGQMETKCGDLDAAQRALRAAREVGFALVERAPDRVAYRERLAGVLTQLASIAATPGDAAIAYEDALAQRAEIVRMEPLNNVFGARFGRTATSLIEAFEASGDLTRANITAVRSLDQLMSLWHLSLPDAHLCDQLAELLHARRRVRLALGQSLRPGDRPELEQLCKIHMMLCRTEDAPPRAFARQATYAMLLNQDETARRTIRMFDEREFDTSLKARDRARLDVTRTILAYRAQPTEANSERLQATLADADLPAWFQVPEFAGVTRVVGGAAGGD